MFLRALELSDAHALASWDDPPTDVQRQRAIIDEQRDRGRPYAAVDSAFQAYVVGWGMIRESDAGEELKWVVAPGCRRRGIGTDIARQLIQKCHRRGPVWVSVRADNDASLRLARKVGFDCVQAVTDDGILTLVHGASV